MPVARKLGMGNLVGSRSASAAGFGSTSRRGVWFDGGRRWKKEGGVKLDLLTISLCKKNIRRMMKVSKWPDQRSNPDPLHA